MSASGTTSVVPRRDHADERVGLVHDGQFLGHVRRSDRADGLVGQELGGVLGPVVHHVGAEDLDVRVAPGLARFPLHQPDQLVGMVEDPVAPPAHPSGASCCAHRLPVGLCRPQPRGDGLDLRTRGHRHRSNDLASSRTRDHFGPFGLDINGFRSSLVVQFHSITSDGDVNPIRTLSEQSSSPASSGR